MRLEARAEVEPQLGEHGVGHLGIVGDDHQQVALRCIEARAELVELRVGEELRDRRAPAVGLAEGPDEALGAELLGAADQPVELGARQLARARVDPLDDAAAVDRAAEDLELGLAQGVGEVDELEPEAGVGAVGAEAADRLVVGQPGQRKLEGPVPEPAEDMGEEPLVDVEHVLDPDERHLEVELGEVGLAVGALLLVAKAARDLVVALEPADHQQLLEELRRLGQRVERTRARGGTGRGSRAPPRESSATASGSRPRESPRSRGTRGSRRRRGRASRATRASARAACRGSDSAAAPPRPPRPRSSRSRTAGYRRRRPGRPRRRGSRTPPSGCRG